MTVVRYSIENKEKPMRKRSTQSREHYREPVSYTHLNAGWRIDYFMTSESLKDRLEDAKIDTTVLGSDHCPVELILKD